MKNRGYTPEKGSDTPPPAPPKRRPLRFLSFDEMTSEQPAPETSEEAYRRGYYAGFKAASSQIPGGQPFLVWAQGKLCDWAQAQNPQQTDFPPRPVVVLGIVVDEED